MTCAAHCREIEKREARISWLEAEVQRQGNIITDLADMNAKWDVRYNALLTSPVAASWEAQARRLAVENDVLWERMERSEVLGYEWTPTASPSRPRLLHPSEIKTLSTSIGILEGQGGTAPRAE